MTDRPLYLSPALIPAFLAGRVSLLIEPLKVQPPDGFVSYEWRDRSRTWVWRGASPLWNGRRYNVPPHAPGDRLWLREAWARAWETDGAGTPVSAEQTYYKSNGEPFDEYEMPDGSTREGIPWRSPITMPKWASRAWAEVEAVEVKRVQDVTDGECEEAGFPGFMSLDCSDCESPREQFQDHFHYVYGSDTWDRNPWCTFTRIKVHPGSLRALANEGKR